MIVVMSFHQCKYKIIEMENERPAFWSAPQFSGGESFFRKGTFYGKLSLLMLFFTLTCPIQDVFSGDIHLLAAAGLRQPIDQLIMAFHKQTGHRVFANYAGSGTLLTRFRASGMGDLFIPGAFQYIRMLDRDGRVHSVKKIVAHVPVLGIHPSKKEQIRTLKDLAVPGIRVALGDPKAMAFGRVAADILEKAKLKNAVSRNVVVYAATVKQLALYVVQGDVDAAIIGRADAIQQKENIHMIDIPLGYRPHETIAVALLKTASDRPEAVQFFEFMGSPKSMETFQQFGFLPLDQNQDRGDQQK